jgi:Tfp pilus assembly protein PilO
MTKMRQWTILTAVAVVVVLAAGWFLLVKPQRSHASSLRATAATQQTANAGLEATISQLEAEQKGLPKAQAALQKFATEVPDNAAEPTIIRQLSAAANRADVDMVTLTPGQASTVTTADTTPVTTPSGTVQGLTPAAATPTTLVELPLSFGITGTYPNVESFFLALEKLPRSILVTGWSLCPEATAGSSGGSCSGPSAPSNKTLPAGSLGGTLTADVFYAPPVAATVPSTTTPTGTTGTTTGTTGTTTGTTPATTSTTPTTAGSAAPAS